MPRSRRVVFDNSFYEIVPRAREGLPLPPTDTTNQLVSGILGRTQRDNKVTLCNFVEMNNHAHQQVIPNEPQQLTKFYMEYQKKITDTVKKLTSLDSLNLWQSRPSVIFISKLEDAIKRVIYIFLNPAKAGLVNSIDEYPGLNTWEYFKSCEPSVDAKVKVDVYWTPAAKVTPLGGERKRLSPADDRLMVQSLKEHPKTVKYELEIHPLAWLKVYGITDPQRIEAIRQRIIKAVYEEEANLAKERLEKRMPVKGVARLKQEEYLKSHTPKTDERRIFVICGDDEARPKVIEKMKDIERKCRECYPLLKEGKPHEWPPGTFMPWVPPKQYHPRCI